MTRIVESFVKQRIYGKIVRDLRERSLYPRSTRPPEGRISREAISEISETARRSIRFFLFSFNSEVPVKEERRILIDETEPVSFR